MRVFWAVLSALALAACSDEPAGGVGPFDPVNDPLPRVYSPVITQPSSGAVGAVPNATGALPAPGSPDAFRREIETALDRAEGTAASPGAALPGPGTPSTLPAGTASVAGTVPAPIVDTGIDPNDQEINLALTPRELQVVQREEAARRLEAARAQRVEVAPEPLPEQDVTANVVRFARETTHAVGTRVYRRPALRSRTQSSQICRRFGSADEAQRQFLANGGPERDRFNLDPDGDGFACRFDPEVYRQLQF